jgi:hypothetical protein
MEEIVDNFGFRRKLGCKPSDESLVAKVMAWPSNMSPLIPRPTWKKCAFFDWPETIKILDQGQTGSCNGHAAIKSMEYQRYVSGMSYQKLSPWYVYSILCGGIDSGSNILDALRLLKEKGTCLDSSVPHGTINPSRLGKSCHEEAKRFRIEVGSRLETWDEIVTSVILRCPINLSVHVGSSFNNLDVDGIPPAPYGPANHAVCCAGGFKITSKGEPSVLCANSWGAKWGFSGFFWITERHFSRSAYFEAYTVASCRDDPSDKSNVPQI